MILSKTVKLFINNNQIKYWKEKGYKVKSGDILSVKVSDLPNNSTARIKVKCDICHQKSEISFRRYIKNTTNKTIDYACSRKCADQKSKITVLEKYGVENVSQSQDIKDKKVETCLKNFGVKHPQQSEKIFEKSKQTKLKLYGDENYVNIEKIKNTNLEKYGVEAPAQNLIIKEKMMKSNNIFHKNRILKNYENIINYENKLYEFSCDCKHNHTFKISYKLLWNRKNSNTTICTICNPISKNISGLEIQLSSFISSNYSGKTLLNCKNIISPYELDIYLPDLNLAFEFNGLYWHNDSHIDKNYHLNKTEKCEKIGIQLFHIFEDDWIYKQEIIKSIILKKLNKISNTISEKEYTIKKVENKSYKIFLENNHIDGYVKANIRIGLFHNNELISIISFNKNKNNFELLRFCNRLNVDIDSASKLFKYFLDNYKTREVIVYVNRSTSQGGIYKKLGFELVSKIKPSFYYIQDGRKTKVLDDTLNKIYDSGKLKFKYSLLFFC